eukprot:GEZU01017654.1.p1 GENE.GEZU01017654.1~~GEZU01017654.1.p1  ORF type:complete len:130 (-),score=18.35 GEZU01017654.1:123-512(-)
MEDHYNSNSPVYFMQVPHDSSPQSAGLGVSVLTWTLEPCHNELIDELAKDSTHQQQQSLLSTDETHSTTTTASQTPEHLGANDNITPTTPLSALTITTERSPTSASSTHAAHPPGFKLNLFKLGKFVKR